MTDYAPFIAPYAGPGGHTIHRIAGHGSGRWLRGNWYALCGRIVPGVTVSEVLHDEGERECRQCRARAERIGLVALDEEYA